MQVMQQEQRRQAQVPDPDNTQGCGHLVHKALLLHERASNACSNSCSTSTSTSSQQPAAPAADRWAPTSYWAAPALCPPRAAGYAML